MHERIDRRTGGRGLSALELIRRATKMEQRFSNESIDLVTLREFCEREGEAVMYLRGDQLEREGDPARWLAYVTEGRFKYVTHGLSDDREHITWFSFEGEFVVDYPTRPPSHHAPRALRPADAALPGHRGAPRLEGHRLVPERHPQDHQQDSQRNHFRQRLATNFSKTLNLG